MGDWQRSLTVEERDQIQRAYQGCFERYAGVRVAHRSCGIALAETFGLPTAPYQSLRRGGITGEGECGTLVAGRLILGEILGDPDPGGATTPALRDAVGEYQARWRMRTSVRGSVVCNDLVAPFADFRGPGRARLCTNLAAKTAALVAETLIRNDAPFSIAPLMVSPSP
ncbi:MAG: C-GCAxxG-C-C family protein [Myxococcota bacterium]